MNLPLAAQVQQILAARTNTNPRDWYFTFKARYGMQVVFEELSRAVEPVRVVEPVRAVEPVETPERIVLTQAFTCGTAVDPILAAGLTPRYCEIDLNTLSIMPPLDGEYAAVVLQHTFGMINPLSAEIAAQAHSDNALLIEDSAHCVGRMALDDSGRPVADISVHSFGVEKMLPTRFGAAIWVSPDLADTELRARIVGSLAGLPLIGTRLDLAARTFRSQVRVLNRLGPAANGTRAALTRLGVFEPAIAPVEKAGELPYPPMRPSPWIMQQMAEQLPRLDEIEKQRAGAVEVYATELTSYPAQATGPLLRFPLYAESEPAAEALIAHLTKNGVFAGRWYRPELFPGVTDAQKYHYDPADPNLPVTRDATARIVNLPTNVSETEAQRISELVKSVR